jgi:hypothetical protein
MSSPRCRIVGFVGEEEDAGRGEDEWEVVDVDAEGGAGRPTSRGVGVAADIIVVFQLRGWYVVRDVDIVARR